MEISTLFLKEKPGKSAQRDLNTWLVSFLKIGVLILLSFFIMAGFIEGDAFAQRGRSAKKEAPECNVLNIYGKAIGSVNEEGTVTNLYGRSVGRINGKGYIFNVSKIVIGSVDDDGKVKNQAGTLLFSVDTEGNIYNVSGRKVGEVRDVKDLKLIGGAARLLFSR